MDGGVSNVDAQRISMFTTLDGAVRLVTMPRRTSSRFAETAISVRTRYKVPNHREIEFLIGNQVRLNALWFSKFECPSESSLFGCYSERVAMYRQVNQIRIGES